MLEVLLSSIRYISKRTRIPRKQAAHMYRANATHTYILHVCALLQYRALPLLLSSHYYFPSFHITLSLDVIKSSLRANQKNPLFLSLQNTILLQNNETTEKNLSTREKRTPSSLSYLFPYTKRKFEEAFFPFITNSSGFKGGGGTGGTKELS
jgi:hypothetical protein